VELPAPRVKGGEVVSTRNAVSQVTFFVAIFFPIIYLLEIESPTFFVPFIEELLARLIPLLITLYFYHNNINPFTVGIAAGMTFGFLEIMTKTIYLKSISYLMFVPIILVHIPNATLQSVVVNFSYNRRTYSLIPVAYFIAVFWHWIYNAYLYVV